MKINKYAVVNGKSHNSKINKHFDLTFDNIYSQLRLSAETKSSKTDTQNESLFEKTLSAQGPTIICSSTVHHEHFM